MHALKFLAPGGRLVALCANGPRQQAALRQRAAYWRDLPAGSFKEAGTRVNVALLVIERPAIETPAAPPPSIAAIIDRGEQALLFDDA